jgi:hypothetical protein
MKTEKRETNDKSQPRAEDLTDLPVTDEQADRATGGFDPQGRLLIGHDDGIWR